jgi:hypothetical protein
MMLAQHCRLATRAVGIGLAELQRPPRQPQLLLDYRIAPPCDSLDSAASTTSTVSADSASGSWQC